MVTQDPKKLDIKAGPIPGLDFGSLESSLKGMRKTLQGIQDREAEVAKLLSSPGGQDPKKSSKRDLSQSDDEGVRTAPDQEASRKAALDAAIKLAKQEEASQTSQLGRQIDAERHQIDLGAMALKNEKLEADARNAKAKATLSEAQTNQALGRTDDTGLDAAIASAIAPSSGGQLQGPPAPNDARSILDEITRQRESILGSVASQVVNNELLAIRELQREAFQRVGSGDRKRDLFETPLGPRGILAGGLLNLLSLPFTSIGLADEGLGTALLGGDVTTRDLDASLGRLRAIFPVVEAQNRLVLGESSALQSAQRIQNDRIRLALRTAEGAREDKITKQEIEFSDALTVEYFRTLPEIAQASGDEEIIQLFGGGQTGSHDAGVGKGLRLFQAFNNFKDGKTSEKDLKDLEELLIKDLIARNPNIVDGRKVSEGVNLLAESISQRFRPDVKEVTSRDERRNFTIQTASVESYVQTLKEFEVRLASRVKEVFRDSQLESRAGKIPLDKEVKDRQFAETVRKLGVPRNPLPGLEKFLPPGALR